MARVIVRSASVGDLHADDPFGSGPPDSPEVRWCRPTDDAVALGSRQDPSILDREACGAAGLSIVRRRSGGGAVLLRRDAVVWIDLVLPHGVAPDDIRRSMVWAGDRWAEALRPFVDGELTIHRGPMVCSPWSDLVCFAGIGPGELLVDGRKFLGLSQRRGRHGIRIQGSVHLRPVNAELAGLFAVPVPELAIDEPHAVPALDAADLAARLAALF